MSEDFFFRLTLFSTFSFLKFESSGAFLRTVMKLGECYAGESSQGKY